MLTYIRGGAVTIIGGARTKYIKAHHNPNHIIKVHNSGGALTNYICETHKNITVILKVAGARAPDVLMWHPHW